MSSSEGYSSSRQTRMSGKISKNISGMTQKTALSTFSETRESPHSADDQYTAVEKMLQKAKALASDLNNKDVYEGESVNEYGGIATAQDNYDRHSPSITTSITPTSLEPATSSTFGSTQKLYSSSNSTRAGGLYSNGQIYDSSNESSPDAGDVYISAPIGRHTNVTPSKSTSIIDTLRSEYNIDKAPYGAGATATSSSSSYLSNKFSLQTESMKPVVDSGVREPSTSATSTVDLKSMLAQRDLELHTLQQNYEIQYQESVILKQKLLETVAAYEEVCKSQGDVQAKMESTKQKEEITFLRNEYEKSQVLLKELEAEKVLFKEMLEQYQHRESNASVLHNVTSNQIDQLDAILQQHKDELAAKQELINKTVREYSTVMSNYESKTEYCLRLETERNTLHKGIEKMKQDLADLFNEKTVAHEEFCRMKNVVDAEVRKNSTLVNELESTRQKLYRVEEQLAVNLKHTNSLTLELISTRKELILANNAVTSLQKYLGENDPHINVYNPKPIPVDEDKFLLDGDRNFTIDSVVDKSASGSNSAITNMENLDSSRFLSSSDKYLLESLSAARDTIASLEIANKELLDALADRQHEVSRLRDEGMEYEGQRIKDLEGQLKNIEDSKKETTKALDNLSVEKQSLLDKISELEGVIDCKDNAAKEDAEKHEASHEELKATIDKMNVENEKLRQDLKDASQLEKERMVDQKRQEEKVTELENESRALQEANELIAGELDDEKQALDVAETRIKGLEELLAANEKKLEDATSNQKKLNDDLHRANLQREYQDKSFAGSQDEIAALEQELRKSREECFGIQFQLQQANKDLADANNKSGRLNKLLAEKDDTIGSMKQELTEMGHKRDMIDKDILHLKENQKRLTEKNTTYEKDLGSAEGENKQLKDAVDKLKSENATKDDEIQKLLAEVGNNTGMIRQLEKGLEDKDREAVEKESDLQLKNEHLDGLRAALDETREILTKRDNQLAEAQKSIEKLLKQNEELMLSSFQSLNNSRDDEGVYGSTSSLSSAMAGGQMEVQELGYFSK